MKRINIVYMEKSHITPAWVLEERENTWFLYQTSHTSGVRTVAGVHYIGIDIPKGEKSIRQYLGKQAKAAKGTERARSYGMAYRIITEYLQAMGKLRKQKGKDYSYYPQVRG